MESLPGLCDGAGDGVNGAAALKASFCLAIDGRGGMLWRRAAKACGVTVFKQSNFSFFSCFPGFVKFLFEFVFFKAIQPTLIKFIKTGCY